VRVANSNPNSPQATVEPSSFERRQQLGLVGSGRPIDPLEQEVDCDTDESVLGDACTLAATGARQSTGVPGDTDARGTTGGSNVTPIRPQGGGSSTAPDSQRRRPVAPLFSQGLGQGTFGQTPVASTEASAPLLPGIPAPPSRAREREAMHQLTTPVVAAAAVLSPLIRPPAVPPVALTSWSTAPEVAVQGLLMAPTPDLSPSPSSSTSDTVR
jgi:hypothetical protein